MCVCMHVCQESALETVPFVFYILNIFYILIVTHHIKLHYGLFKQNQFLLILLLRFSVIPTTLALPPHSYFSRGFLAATCVVFHLLISVICLPSVLLK